MTKARVKFKPGKLVMTTAVFDAANKDLSFGTFIHDCLRKHLEGNWGEISSEDKHTNELALQMGFRLFSVYKNKAQVTIWIITEADRSVTTILFPEDY